MWPSPQVRLFQGKDPGEFFLPQVLLFQGKDPGEIVVKLILIVVLTFSILRSEPAR